MNHNALGVFLVALSSLLLELTLIRIFDILWYPNMAYMIITLAVFSFGLAGVYLSIRPVGNSQSVWKILSIATFVMAVWVLFMQSAIDRLPFDYNLLASAKSRETIINFFLIYVVVCVPFFFAGLALSLVFSHYTRQIQRLYFWDLLGAAIGCLILIPLLPRIGTSGALQIVAGLSLLSCLVFSQGGRISNKAVRPLIAILAMLVIAYPFTRDSIDTFEPHMNKRGYATLQHKIKVGTWWDPISKIDVLDTEQVEQNRKWIAYDGGTQSSHFYPFDGDFEYLRKNIRTEYYKHFWNTYVAASHFLKADTGARVLIIGSAGGQELKAALTYNPSEVDAIELVGTVVELGKNDFSDYIGNIMNDPRANVMEGEGRSYLRASNKQYDIIQMFSNHTSSSIAAGSGSMQANYLQTVDAYKEYFTHLSDNGVLHINHHIYPKMVATASRAWAELGRDNFRRHVFVSENHGVRDGLPTMLIKMQPWEPDELNRVKSLLAKFYFPVDPSRDSSFLSEEFFTGKLSTAFIDKVPYRIEEPTDDKPFFNSLRVNLDTLPDNDAELAVNYSVSGLMNSQKSQGFPIDVIHLFITAVAAIVFAVLFTIVPMLFARTGRETWVGKVNFMIYFSCLGLGFIVYELVFIQIYMKLIGYPLYTYTTVLFTFLFGAGLGSLASEKLQLIEKKRFYVPFVGILASTLLTVFNQHVLFDLALQFGIFARIAASVLMILPLAFFLGMPFPLGLLAIKDKPQGTVAWAWALNGLFTVAGGVFCAIFAVYFGFTATMMVALASYVFAFFLFKPLAARA